MRDRKGIETDRKAEARPGRNKERTNTIRIYTVSTEKPPIFHKRKNEKKDMGS